MQRLKSILLLFIMAMLIAPWSLLDFCIAHPFGHDHHHEPGKPTPCELRAKAIRESNGPIMLPPMDCDKFSVNADDYQAPDDSQVKPTTQTLVVAAVLLDIVRLDYPEEPFPIPPDPKCRSATVISTRQLRAPPLV